MTDPFWRVLALALLAIIAFSLYTIAAVSAYDFAERRLLPPVAPKPEPPDDDD